MDLENALANSSNYWVRMAAAQMLVALHLQGEEDRLYEAYQKEDVPIARINIAGALAAVDPSRGTAALREMCDSGATDRLRLAAARRLQPIAPNGCHATVLQVGSRSSQPAAISDSLDLLGKELQKRPASPEEVDLIKKGLTSETSDVRRHAIRSTGLAAESNPSLVTGLLQEQLAKESDPVLRALIEQTLSAR